LEFKKVSKIDIVLENCEVLTFDRVHIDRFYMDGIFKSISIDSHHLEAKGSYLKLNIAGNTLDAYAENFRDLDDLEFPFDRISKHHDIVAIDVHFEDGTSNYIFVNWYGTDDYVNEYVSTKIGNESGNLYIVIHPEEDVDSHFKNKYTINDFE
jgi:hypothetical protein